MNSRSEQLAEYRGFLVIRFDDGVSYLRAQDERREIPSLFDTFTEPDPATAGAA